MKKSILAIAVASMAVSSAAMAESTVYGNIHLSINQFGDGTAQKMQSENGGSGSDELDMTSNTSSIGVKGSEDLSGGTKAIYKVEFQLDAADGASTGDALTQRDIFAGLKGGWGTAKAGIMSSNYKQMGGKVDSLYRTPAEGRGFIATQSAALHGGRGVNRGRQTNTIQYSTPKFGGFEIVANTTVSGAKDGTATTAGTAETTGIGGRWSNKSFLVYVDWIDGATGAVDASNNAITESATKLGGKWSGKSFFVAGQYEDAAKRTGYDFMHLNGGWLINANNILTATYGGASHDTDGNLDTTGMALAYVHNLSKMTNVYVAWMDRSSDTKALEDDAFALGFKKKF